MGLHSVETLSEIENTSMTLVEHILYRSKICKYRAGKFSNRIFSLSRSPFRT